MCVCVFNILPPNNFTSLALQIFCGLKDGKVLSTKVDLVHVYLCQVSKLPFSGGLEAKECSVLSSSEKMNV